MIKKTSIIKLKSLFKSLGLKKNDTVFVHSSLFSLGIIDKGIDGFHSALKEVIGVYGTIIVPTFTYSFRRNEKFDIQNTPSAKTIGLYSEYIRKKNSVRSSDPLFSMAAIGPMANKLMKRNSFNCFGEHSIYEKLFDQDVKFLCIGISYSSGLSAFMHIEKKAKVPYRKDLMLSGISIGSKGEQYKDYVIHFARDEKNFFDGAKIDREEMGLYLEKNKISKSLNYRYGKHFLISAKQFEQSVLEKLEENPLFMYKQNHK